MGNPLILLSLCPRIMFTILGGFGSTRHAFVWPQVVEVEDPAGVTWDLAILK